MKLADFAAMWVKDIEWFISTKSWWDTVDALSVNVAGLYFKKFPNQIAEIIPIWNSSINMWLNRAAILFQLKYKDGVDERLLTDVILTHADSKEFFLQKAIGWLLREYSKTKPAFVWEFLDKNSLKPLSLREASKYL